MFWWFLQGHFWWKRKIFTYFLLTQNLVFIVTLLSRGDVGYFCCSFKWTYCLFPCFEVKVYLFFLGVCVSIQSLWFFMLDQGRTKKSTRFHTCMSWQAQFPKCRSQMRWRISHPTHLKTKQKRNITYDQGGSVWQATWGHHFVILSAGAASFNANRGGQGEGRAKKT